MIPENNLLPLNDTEHFLKNFLKKFPVYQTKIINSLVNEPDYIYLLHLLETEWHKQLPDQTFFSPVHPDIFLKIFLFLKIRMSVF